MELSINIWHLIFVEMLLVVLSGLMALIQTSLINEDKKIAHGWWALGFAIVCACAAFLTGFYVWWFWLAQAIGHLPIFNVLLDILRNKPIDYVSPTPKSIIDRLVGKALPILQIVCAILYAGAQALIIHFYGNN